MILPWNRDTSLHCWELSTKDSNCQLCCPTTSSGRFMNYCQASVYLQAQCNPVLHRKFWSIRDQANRMIRHWKAPNATWVAWYLFYLVAALSWCVLNQSPVSWELRQTIGSNDWPHWVPCTVMTFSEVMIDLIRFQPCKNENLQHWNKLWSWHLISFSHCTDPLIQQWTRWIFSRPIPFGAKGTKRHW